MKRLYQSSLFDRSVCVSVALCFLATSTPAWGLAPKTSDATQREMAEGAGRLRDGRGVEHAFPLEIEGYLQAPKTFATAAILDSTLGNFAFDKEYWQREGYAAVRKEAERPEARRAREIAAAMTEFERDPAGRSEFLTAQQARLAPIVASAMEDMRVLGLQMPDQMELHLRVGSRRFSHFHKEDEPRIITMDLELLYLPGVPEEVLRFFLIHELLHAAVSVRYPGWSRALSEIYALFAGVAILWQREELRAVSRFFDTLQRSRRFGATLSRELARKGGFPDALQEVAAVQEELKGMAPPDPEGSEKALRQAFGRVAHGIFQWIRTEPTYREDMPHLNTMLDALRRQPSAPLSFARPALDMFGAYLEKTDQDSAFRLARKILGEAMIRQLREKGESFTAMAKGPASILLMGEDGLHRELLARVIHHLHQKDRVEQGGFERLDARTLDEGELRGLFEPESPFRKRVRNGTVYIHRVEALNRRDRIALGDIVADARRTGEIRFVLSSNMDLAQAVGEGEFPLDVFHRLNVGETLKLPPLRARSEAERTDLIKLLLSITAAMAGKPQMTLSKKAMEHLLDLENRWAGQAPWRGNIFELESVLQRAVARARSREIQDTDLIFGHESYPFDPGQFRRIASAEIPVLIHAAGRQDAWEYAQRLATDEDPKAPLAEIHAGALSDQNIPGELYGDENTGRIGKLERARGGTLVVHDVELLTPRAQRHLLRVMRRGGYRRVPGGPMEAVRLRWIFTTTADLKQKVENGELLAELYYLMQGYPMTLPPLWERPDEIPYMVQRILEALAATAGRDMPPKVTPRAMKLLTHYPWPEGLAQMEPVVAAAFDMSDKETIDAEHLPEALRLENILAAHYPDFEEAKEIFVDLHPATDFYLLGRLLPQHTLEVQMLSDPEGLEEFSMGLKSLLQGGMARFSVAEDFDVQLYRERSLGWLAKAFGEDAIVDLWWRGSLPGFLRYLFEGYARQSVLEEALAALSGTQREIAGHFNSLPDSPHVHRRHLLRWMRMQRGLFDLYVHGWPEAAVPAERQLGAMGSERGVATLLIEQVQRSASEGLGEAIGKMYRAPLERTIASVLVEDSTMEALETLAENTHTRDQERFGTVLRGSNEKGAWIEKYFELPRNTAGEFIDKEALGHVVEVWRAAHGIFAPTIHVVANTRVRSSKEHALFASFPGFGPGSPDRIKEDSKAVAPRASDFFGWAAEDEHNADGRRYVAQVLEPIVGHSTQWTDIPEIIAGDVLGRFYVAGYVIRDAELGRRISLMPPEGEVRPADLDVEAFVRRRDPNMLREREAIEFYTVRPRQPGPGGQEYRRFVPPFMIEPLPEETLGTLSRKELAVLDLVLHPQRDEFVREEGLPPRRGMVPETDMTLDEELDREGELLQMAVEIPEEINKVFAEGTLGVLGMESLREVVFTKQTEDSREFVKRVYSDRNPDDPDKLRRAIQPMFEELLERYGEDPEKSRKIALLFARLYGLLLRQHEADLELKFGNRHDAVHVATLLREADRMISENPLLDEETLKAHYGPEGRIVALLAVLSHDLGYAEYVRIQRTKGRLGERAPPKSIHSGLSVRIADTQLKDLLFDIFDLGADKPNAPGKRRYDDFRQAIIYHSASRKKPQDLVYDEKTNPLLFLTTLVDKLDYRYDRTKPYFRRTEIFKKIQEYRDDVYARGESPVLFEAIRNEIRSLREEDPEDYDNFLHSFGNMPVVSVQPVLMLGEKEIDKTQFAALTPEDRARVKLVIRSTLDTAIVRLTENLGPGFDGNPAMFQIERTRRVMARFRFNGLPVEVQTRDYPPAKRDWRSEVQWALLKTFGDKFAPPAEHLADFRMVAGIPKAIDKDLGAVKGLFSVLLETDGEGLPRIVGGDKTLLYPFVRALAGGLPVDRIRGALAARLRLLAFGDANDKRDAAAHLQAKERDPETWPEQWTEWAQDWMDEALAHHEQARRTYLDPTTWRSSQRWRGQLDAFTGVLVGAAKVAERVRGTARIGWWQPGFPPETMADAADAMARHAIAGDVRAVDKVQASFYIDLGNGDRVLLGQDGAVLAFDLRNTRKQRLEALLIEKLENAGRHLLEKLREHEEMLHDNGVWELRMAIWDAGKRFQGFSGKLTEAKERLMSTDQEDLKKLKGQEDAMRAVASEMEALLGEYRRLAKDLLDQGLLREDEMRLFEIGAPERRAERLVPNFSQRVAAMHAALSGEAGMEKDHAVEERWTISRVPDSARLYQDWLKAMPEHRLGKQAKAKMVLEEKAGALDILVSFNRPRATAVALSRHVGDRGLIYVGHGLRERRGLQGDKIAFMRYRRHGAQVVPEHLAFSVYRGKRDRPLFPTEQIAAIPDLEDRDKLREALAAVQEGLGDQEVQDRASHAGVLRRAYLMLLQRGMRPALDEQNGLLGLTLAEDAGGKRQWHGPPTPASLAGVRRILQGTTRPATLALAFRAMTQIVETAGDVMIRAEALDIIHGLQWMGHRRWTWLREETRRWTRNVLIPMAREENHPVLARKMRTAMNLASADSLSAPEGIAFFETHGVGDRMAEAELIALAHAHPLEPDAFWIWWSDKVQSLLSDASRIDADSLAAWKTSLHGMMQKSKDSNLAGLLAGPLGAIARRETDGDAMQGLLRTLTPHTGQARRAASLHNLVDSLLMLTDPVHALVPGKRSKWMRRLAYSVWIVPGDPGLRAKTKQLIEQVFPEEDSRKEFYTQFAREYVLRTLKGDNPHLKGAVPAGEFHDALAIEKLLVEEALRRLEQEGQPGLPTEAERAAQEAWYRRVRTRLGQAKRIIRRLSDADFHAYMGYLRHAAGTPEPWWKATRLPGGFEGVTRVHDRLRVLAADLETREEHSFTEKLFDYLGRQDKARALRVPRMERLLDDDAIKGIMHSPDFQVLHETYPAQESALDPDSWEGGMDKTLQDAFLLADQNILDFRLFSGLNIRAPPDFNRLRVRLVHHEDLLQYGQHAVAWTDPSDTDIIYITHEIWKALDADQRRVLLARQIVEAQALASATPHVRARARAAARTTQETVDVLGHLDRRVDEALKDYRIYNGVEQIELVITHPHGDHSNYVLPYVQGKMRNLIGRIVPPLQEKLQLYLGNRFTHEVTSYMLRPSKRVVTIFDLGGYKGEGQDPYIETINPHYRIGDKILMKRITIHADLYTAKTLDFQARVDRLRKKGFRVELKIFDHGNLTHEIVDSDGNTVLLKAHPAFHLPRFIGSSILTLKKLDRTGKPVSSFSLVSEVGDTLPYRLSEDALADIAASDIVAVDGTNTASDPEYSPTPVRLQDNKIHEFTDRMNRGYATLSHFNTSMLGSVQEALEASRTLDPEVPIVVFAGAEGIKKLRRSYEKKEDGTPLVKQDGELIYIDSGDIQSDSRGARVYLVSDMKAFGEAWRSQVTGQLPLRDMLEERSRAFYASGRSMKEVAEYLADWASSPGLSEEDFTWLFKRLKRGRWDFASTQDIVASFLWRARQEIRDHFGREISLGRWYLRQWEDALDTFAKENAPRWNALSKGELAKVLHEEISAFVREAIPEMAQIAKPQQDLRALANAMEEVDSLEIAVEGVEPDDVVKRSVAALKARLNDAGQRLGVPESFREEVAERVRVSVQLKMTEWHNFETRHLPFLILEEGQRALGLLAGEQPWSAQDAGAVSERLADAINRHRKAGVELTIGLRRGVLRRMLSRGNVPEAASRRGDILGYLARQDREDPEVLIAMARLFDPKAEDLNRRIAALLRERPDGKGEGWEDKLLRLWAKNKKDRPNAKQMKRLVQAWTGLPWLRWQRQEKWIQTLLGYYARAARSNKPQLGLSAREWMDQALGMFEEAGLPRWPRAQKAKSRSSMFRRIQNIKNVPDEQRQALLHGFLHAVGEGAEQAALLARLSQSEAEAFDAFKKERNRKKREQQALRDIESTLWETAKSGTGRILTIGTGYFGSARHKAVQVLDRMLTKRYAEILLEGRPRTDGPQGRIPRHLFQSGEVWSYGEKKPVLARCEHQWRSGHITFEEAMFLLIQLYNARVRLGLANGPELLPDRGVHRLSAADLQRLVAMDLRVLFTTSSKMVTPAGPDEEMMLAERMSEFRRRIVEIMGELFEGLEFGAGYKSITVGRGTWQTREYSRYLPVGSGYLRELYDRSVAGTLPRDLADLPGSKKPEHIAEDIDEVLKKGPTVPRRRQPEGAHETFRAIFTYAESQVLRLGLRIQLDYGSQRVIEQEEIGVLPTDRAQAGRLRAKPVEEQGLHWQIIDALQSGAAAVLGEEVTEFFRNGMNHLDHYVTERAPRFFDQDGKLTKFLKAVTGRYTEMGFLKVAVLADPLKGWVENHNKGKEEDDRIHLEIRLPEEQTRKDAIFAYLARQSLEDVAEKAQRRAKAIAELAGQETFRASYLGLDLIRQGNRLVLDFAADRALPIGLPDAEELLQTELAL